LENTINPKMFLYFLTNSEVNTADPVLAGHTIKGRDFQEKYLNKLFHTPQIVGVFLQDRVSSYLQMAGCDTDHHRISLHMFISHATKCTLSSRLVQGAKKTNFSTSSMI